MTLTTARLALIAAELESDVGFAFPANDGEAGYWLRIAVALELAADIESELTGTVPEYMLRACLALEVLSSVDGSAFNATEAGYVERMVASFEVLNTDTYTGTIGVKLLEAVTDFTPTAIGYIVHDSEIVTFNGLPIKSGTEVDVELATALAALTGSVVIGGDDVTISGDAEVVGATTLATAVADSLACPLFDVTGIQTADGVVGTLWSDSNTVKVSIA